MMVRLVFVFIIIPGAIYSVVRHLNNIGFFNLNSSVVLIGDVPLGQSAYFNPLKDELNEELKKFEGTSLWSLSLRSINNVVLKNKWIRSVQIKKNWPNGLELNIVPVEIKFVMAGEAEKVLPITSTGEVLDPVDYSRAPDGIFLSSSFLKNKQERAAVSKLIREIPSRGFFSQQTISEIRIEKDGFWVKLMRAGVDIKLGNDDVAIKSARVSKVMEYLESHEMEARVIDADLSKKVLVRLRQAP